MKTLTILMSCARTQTQCNFIESSYIKKRKENALLRTGNNNIQYINRRSLLT